MCDGLELVAVDFCMSGIAIKILRLIKCDCVCVCVDFDHVVMACCIWWPKCVYIELLVGILSDFMFSSYMSYVEQLLICAAWSICVTSCLV